MLSILPSFSMKVVVETSANSSVVFVSSSMVSPAFWPAIKRFLDANPSGKLDLVMSSVTSGLVVDLSHNFVAGCLGARESVPGPSFG